MLQLSPEFSQSIRNHAPLTLSTEAGKRACTIMHDGNRCDLAGSILEHYTGSEPHLQAGRKELNRLAVGMSSTICDCRLTLYQINKKNIKHPQTLLIC